MIVRGIQSTQHAMLLMNAKVNTIRVKAMDNFAFKTSQVSKQKCPVDTGALRDSIQNKLNKATPVLIQEKVSAGDPGIQRGIGKYSKDKSGNPVSVQATTEYAIKVNETHPTNKGFMDEGFKWAGSRGVAEIRRSIRKVMGMI